MNTPEPSELDFISLVDAKGRKSSLAINGGPHYQAPGSVKVVGNLEHGTDLKPASHADGVKLADFATNGTYRALVEALELAEQCLRPPIKGQLKGYVSPELAVIRAALSKAKGTP